MSRTANSWHEFDRRLCDLELRGPQRRMHAETLTRRRRVVSEHRTLGQGDGVGLYAKIVDSDLSTVREYLADVDKCCRKTWQTQGKAITPDFVRAMLRNAIVPAIDARKGAIEWDLTLMARRTGFYGLAPVLDHLAREANRLKSEVCDRYEAEAITLSYKMAQNKIPNGDGNGGPGEAEWDVFVSYASEDKCDFALPLADELRARGLAIWFDDFELRVGDSLRRSIDKGLARSRYGVVILSPQFFAKDWPQRELDGLVAKESGRDKVILPVWHRIDVDGVRRFSPILADRVAARSTDGLEEVVRKILAAIPKSNRQT